MKKNKILFWMIVLLAFSVVGATIFAGEGKVMDKEPFPDLQAKKKANVIIILTDDQGFGDVSRHGNPILETPALDKLHDESIRFSDFHATPLCTPSRGQLLTGLDALDNKASTVGKGRGLIRRDLLTMPEILKKQGYSTGIFGKWHLGHSFPDRPMDQGFDKSIWIKGWGIYSEMEFDNDYYKTRYIDSLQTIKSDKYCTDLWFDKAMEWMDEKVNEEQPFFTYLSLNAPHGPFHAPEEDFNYYNGKVDKTTANFFGLIRNIDKNMQRLDDWLLKKGIKDNTILIFMTDNGTAGGDKVFNAGMRGKKGSIYEGGHRVPFYVRWPNGNLGSPRTENYSSQIQDILPTIVDLLDFKMEENNPFDGLSLEPVLRQQYELQEDRMFVVQFGGLKELQQKYYSSVVWNSWRLIGKDELYDLKTDPGQEQNIADSHPEVFQKMLRFYEDWWTDLEPNLDVYVPIVVGSQENPVILSPDMWEGNSVNTQWKVANAAGDPKGGIWNLDVKKEGKYRLELSRWPFHLERPLTLAGPERSIGGTEITPGKSLPIALGCVAIGNKVPVFTKSKAGATKVTMDVELSSGRNQLQTWFKDKEGKDLCGAYYVKVEFLVQ